MNHPVVLYFADNNIVLIGITGDGVAVEAWCMQLALDMSTITPSYVVEAKRRWYLHARPIPALPRPPQPTTKAEP